MASSSLSSMKYATGSPYLAGSLATQKYAANKELPNEYDINAQTFSELRKGLGDKPRGWKALATGVLQGLEHGSKISGLGMRKQELAEYNKVMDYLGAVNQAAMDKNQWYEKREMAQQKYMPEVLAYATHATKMDPQSRKIMAQNILEGYSRMAGEDYKLNTIDGADPLLLTVTKGDQTRLIDLRDLVAGDTLMRERLAMQMPEYQQGLSDKRKQQELENQFKQQQLDINRGYLDLEKGKAQPTQAGGESQLEIPLASLGSLEKRKIVDSINQKITLGQGSVSALRVLDEMETLANENKHLDSFWNLTAGKVSEAVMSEKDRTAIARFKKLSSHVAQPLINAAGSNITDSQRATINEGIPQWNQPLQAKLDNIATKRRELLNNIAWGEYAANALKRGMIATQSGFESFLAQNPRFVAQGVDPSVVTKGDFSQRGAQGNNPQEEGSPSPKASTDKVLVTLPTGQTGYMLREEYNRRIAGGQNAASNDTNNEANQFFYGAR
jgi:hypothetical protein